MKLVVVYWVGDEFSYSWDIVQPIEYESAEAFLVNLEDAIKAAQVKQKESGWRGNGVFKIPGKNSEFNFEDFQDRNSKGVWEINLPEVYTVDEWFEKYHKE